MVITVNANNDNNGNNGCNCDAIRKQRQDSVNLVHIIENHYNEVRYICRDYGDNVDNYIKSFVQQFCVLFNAVAGTRPCSNNNNGQHRSVDNNNNGYGNGCNCNYVNEEFEQYQALDVLHDILTKNYNAIHSSCKYDNSQSSFVKEFCDFYNYHDSSYNSGFNNNN